VKFGLRFAPHPVRESFTKALLEYNCGHLSDRQLLDAATGSNWSGCEAHFHVALRRLGDGDRDGAREQFRASVHTGILPFFEYKWSRSILARMEKDDSWPPWIPIKKG
jgi:hypothetical protein